MTRLSATRPSAGKSMTTVLTTGLAMAATTAMLAAGSAQAETRIETVIGTVTSSTAIKNSYIRKTPSDQKVCETQDVPIYGEASANNDGGSDLGAMIIGGVLGSAIGNKASDNEGAGAAGAVVGAILGREHAKKNKQGQQIVGYRQQEVCNIRKVMLEETVEEITGYRNRIEIDGKIITLESATPFASNERVEINRRTTYSLR